MIKVDDILLILLLLSFACWIYFSIINNIRYKQSKTPYKKVAKIATIFMIIFLIINFTSFILTLVFNIEFPIIEINSKQIHL